MGKITEFSINFNTQKHVFYPGEPLTGFITLDLKQPMDMRALNIKLSGKGYCHWTERHSSGSGKNRRTTTRHYTGNENIINQVQTLFSGKQHPAGRYVYQFVFNLKHGIPSSFEGQIGFIRYILKANIDKPWKFDHKVKRPFTVNDVIDTNNTMYHIPVGGEQHKDVGCLCCAAGPLEMTVSIDRSCFCPGEAILINANIQNSTTRDMDDMHVKLIQTVTYHASNKSRTFTKEIARMDGPSIAKGTTAAWENQPFGIPATPPTITNSSVITVHYKVKVTVAVPWGIDPTIKMHITIGTVPFRGRYGEQVPPQIQQAAGPSCSPSHSGFSAYYDQPPSYAAAMGETGVNIAGKKDAHTYGDLQYIPVYTFASAPPRAGAVQPQQYPPNQHPPNQLR